MSSETVEPRGVARDLTGELRKEQRLRETDALELREMQSLVRAVRARLRIVHAGDEDLRLREELREVEQEGDAPTRADVDGFRTPRLRQRRVHRAVGRTARLRHER